MSITIDTTVQRKAREDYRVLSAGPSEKDLITAESWICEHGCSREAAALWLKQVHEKMGIK